MPKWSPLLPCRGQCQNTGAALSLDVAPVAAYWLCPGILPLSRSDTFALRYCLCTWYLPLPSAMAFALDYAFAKGYCLCPQTCILRCASVAVLALPSHRPVALARCYCLESPFAMNCLYISYCAIDSAFGSWESPCDSCSLSLSLFLSLVLSLSTALKFSFVATRDLPSKGLVSGIAADTAHSSLTRKYGWKFVIRS